MKDTEIGGRLSQIYPGCIQAPQMITYRNMYRQCQQGLNLVHAALALPTDSDSYLKIMLRYRYETVCLYIMCLFETFIYIDSYILYQMFSNFTTVVQTSKILSHLGYRQNPTAV